MKSVESIDVILLHFSGGLGLIVDSGSTERQPGFVPQFWKECSISVRGSQGGGRGWRYQRV